MYIETGIILAMKANRYDPSEQTTLQLYTQNPDDCCENTGQGTGEERAPLRFPLSM